jgi:NAD(P)-dependent dehydrogenase (short-subunit alcohol dehydrogenase family)
MPGKKVILITGISSGFGKESAELLAKKGHTVYGTLRKPCPVSPSVHSLIMDLTDPDSIARAIKTVLEKEGRIDVLINNAGMHSGGPIEEAPPELFRAQTETNIHGLIGILQHTLPVMRAQGKGLIINISSIGGLMGLPFQGFYSASKFAVEGISEALRMEVKQFNIKVVVINPGDFHTRNTANRIKVVDKDGPYIKQFTKSMTIIEKDENGGGDPKTLAHVSGNIVERKNPRYRYVVASWDQKLAVVLKRILPAWLFEKILASHYGI